MEFLLGSQSPRRKEILGYFDIPFRQVSSSFHEEGIPFNGNPAAYVQSIADGKAQSLASLYPLNIILTADTTVYKDGKVYNKPNTPEEAFQFLRELSGSWHSVFTALTLQTSEKKFSIVEETKVLFNHLTEEEIHIYYQKLPYADKAGGYMIQQAGGLIVKKIDGCYYNVMGLPINALRTILLNIGIDLWNHLK